ncbi:MAG: trypsin-like peptidase domain-containing protein [Dehalococcoidia bacterium]
MIIAVLWPLSLTLVATGAPNNGTSEVEGELPKVAVELASLGVQRPSNAATTDVGDQASSLAAAIKAVVRVSSDHSAGSGVVIDQTGLVLTAAHIVDDQGSVRVSIDGKSLEAELVLIDKRRDLALVRLPAGSYPWAQLRDIDAIRPGEPVTVVGYPLNLAGPATATGGIVSRVFEEVGSSRQVVQTDAAINIGNSGGPMFDTRGRVLGIVSSILGEYRSTPTSGISFAVSSKTITEKFLR